MGSTCISEGGDARIHVCKTLALFGIVVFYLLGVVWGNGGSKPCSAVAEDISMYSRRLKREDVRMKLLGFWLGHS